MTNLVASKPLRIVFYSILLLFALVQVYPIFWVFASSMKTSNEMLMTSSFSLPGSLYLGNYTHVIRTSIVPRALLNSVIVAVGVLVFDILLSCPAAFAIGKLQFKMKNKLLTFFLMGMMIPIFVCMIPMFRVYNTLGLRNTYLALILPQLGFGLPMSIYMYVGFLSFVPNSLLEAAWIDGAGSFKTFWYIVAPMVKNTTVTILTFKFIAVWNEFTYANTFISDKNMKTIPTTLKDFSDQIGALSIVNWGATYAAITLAILPTLIVYFLLSKHVIEGMALGAIKN